MTPDKIRCFGRELDPKDYYKGFGWRGFLFRLINIVRERAERWQVLNALRFEARKSGLGKSEEKALIKAAKRDPALEPWVVVGSVKHSHRLRMLSSADGDDRANRYHTSRLNNEAVINRPVQIDDGALAVTALLAHKQRYRSHSRYSGGRSFLVFESEE